MNHIHPRSLSVDMATGRKGSTSKGGGVRFPDDDDPPGSPTRRDDLSNNASIIAIPETDGSFLVKAGFLRSQNRYEIVFTVLETPSLGKDICALPPSSSTRRSSSSSRPSSSSSTKSGLRVNRIAPTAEGGVRVTCEYTTNQEGVMQEELTLVSKEDSTLLGRARRERGLRVRLQARVMDRHHGTPMLLEGVRFLGGTEKDCDTKLSDRNKI